MSIFARASASLLLLFSGVPALAQSDDDSGATRRTRVSLGAQLAPKFPGADLERVRPLIDVATARGDDPFPFEPADESTGFALYSHAGLEIGPVFNIQGSRRGNDVHANIDEVVPTVELGGSVGYWLAPKFRAYAELRRGVNGHDGLISDIGLDYVMRDGDRWLVSVGPRFALSDAQYRRAYFGVSARAAAATGLPTYSAGGDPLHGVGVSTTILYQLTPRFGIYSYAAAKRLVGDAADSPLVRRYGSRNQLWGGVALSVTFGKGVR